MDSEQMKDLAYRQAQFTLCRRHGHLPSGKENANGVDVCELCGCHFKPSKPNEETLS